MIKDLFIFSCYTGLAYIDVFNLSPSHIVEVAEGEFWIKTTRQKTNTPVTVPLLPKALAITVTLTNGVPIESISKMLGHTKLSTTQIYAKVVESKLSSDMNKLSRTLQEL